MGHRHTSDSSQFFEIDQDWNHGTPAAGPSYVHMGRAAAPANGSFAQPIHNTSASELNCSSRRNLESRSIDHSSRNFRFEDPQLHTSLPESSQDVLPPFTCVGSCYPATEINAAHGHSSHYNRHIIHEVETGLLDHSMANGRGPFKRKSPDLSVSWERGSTSGIYGEGSSSNSFEPQLEKPTSDYRNYTSASTALPPYAGGSLSIGGEESPRNVRSRSRLEMEPNTRRNYLSSYSSRSSCSTSHQRNHPVPGNVTHLNADATSQNLIGVSPPVHGRIQTSANNSLGRGMNHYYVDRSPTDVGGYHPESSLSRNAIVPPQYHYGFNSQAAREGQTNYSWRALPSRRTELRSSALGQEVVASENGRQLLSETFNSRYPRPLPAGGWHNNHREGRPRIAIERFQSFSNSLDTRDRMEHEALMMFDHSYLYGSRNLFDQYRDMRLDIDNMSYEELLDLGERMGNVSTGLSEDVISKCLTMTICPPVDKNQEDMSCAICLEEYKNMDKVGTVKSCGHSYHVDCIKKWLSMKNACPICKAPAVNDS